ncbi:hypothetical protein AB1Y20_010462 [Prymnesium parvum]|uniref:Uncharacterized protein n=1 Tax=Prymnesium parvum TaxID=97485 RepID=A0AB34IPS7_PRYPA
MSSLPSLVGSRIPEPSPSGRKRPSSLLRPPAGASAEPRELLQRISQLTRKKENLTARTHHLAKRLHAAEAGARALSERNDGLCAQVDQLKAAVERMRAEAHPSSRERELALWRELAERDRLVHEATRRAVVAEAERKASSERADAAEAEARRLQEELAEAVRRQEEMEARGHGETEARGHGETEARRPDAPREVSVQLRGPGETARAAEGGEAIGARAAHDQSSAQLPVGSARASPHPPRRTLPDEASASGCERILDVRLKGDDQAEGMPRGRDVKGKYLISDSGSRRRSP